MSKVFVIAQGGGPTAVINQTVAGAAIAAMKRHPGAKVLGARHGVRGIRDGNLIELSALSEADLRRFADTPNAGLGSTRDKPDAAYCATILERLKAAKADAFIYIGGNDTAGTLRILEESAGGGMAFVHGPKTIDNDLVENDHTPGFISAGDLRRPRLPVDGPRFPRPPRHLRRHRHGPPRRLPHRRLGGLAREGKRRAASGLPAGEAISRWSSFSPTSRAVREKYGRCVVAMSEGVTTADGKPLVESLVGEVERDAHGNVQLSTGDLGIAVQAALSKAFPKVRARVDTFGYLPRAFSGRDLRKRPPRSLRRRRLCRHGGGKRQLLGRDRQREGRRAASRGAARRGRRQDAADARRLHRQGEQHHFAGGHRLSSPPAARGTGGLHAVSLASPASAFDLSQDGVAAKLASCRTRS